MKVLKHVAIWHNGMLTIIPDAVDIEKHGEGSVSISKSDAWGYHFFHNVTQLTVFYGKQEHKHEV